MRTIAITALLLTSLPLGDATIFAELLRCTSASTTTTRAILGSTPSSYDPAVTQVLHGSIVERLDLRDAPAVPALPAAVPTPAAHNANANSVLPSAAPVALAAPTVAPANPPANVPAISPVVAPAAPPAVPPAPAAVPLTPAPNPPPAVPTHAASISITVQWVETWIGGTSRTWMPRTITLHNQVLSGAAALPGKGEIGMGTLTGHAGITKTVIKGAAKTVGSEWKMGAVAAMGIGIAGLV